MKTVLFLIPSLGGGGAERVLVNLVNNLDRSEYGITVQTLFKGGVNEKCLDDSVEYLPGPVKEFHGNVMLLKLFSPEVLYRIIVKKEYDIAVSFLEGPTARIISGCPFRNSKKVSWIHVEQSSASGSNQSVDHSPAYYSFRSDIEAEQCYQKYDKIVCVAETVKKNFQSIFPNISNCEVLYNIVEASKIHERAKEKIPAFPNGINVISVGRLCYEKGYDRLIKVHKRLLTEGIKHNIYVLGTGDGLSDLCTLAEEEKVKDSFFCLGYQENPYPYIAKADMFVCSSRREGFSTAVTEALILGKPVVSTNCSGAHELLGYGNEYGIVTENSEDGIYSGMKKMLQRDVMEHYRVKALERGQAFSAENAVKAVEKMFSSL